MSTEEFRKAGYKAIDWIADYYDHIENYPVFPQVQPGEIRSKLPKEPPQKGKKYEDILQDMNTMIPGITHWQSPNFHAFFPCATSGPAILGDLISTGLGINGMNWVTSPSATELESHVLDWLVDMMELPNKFKSIAFTGNSPLAAIENPIAKIYGLQFHPEVVHTAEGGKIINNFLFKICKCTANWKMESLMEYMVEDIRKQVGNEKVICGLSGGVDSSVAAVLIHKAIGDNLYCLFIDNGLLRTGERDKVEKTFRDNFNINLDVIDASDKFLNKLKGVTDPEKKRKSIGNTFIDVFEEEGKRLGDFTFLAQGTLYPDVIESISFKGPSAVIKSHHNVGGLPEKMNLKLLEPFRELFKDEVRKLG